MPWGASVAARAINNGLDDPIFDYAGLTSLPAMRYADDRRLAVDVYVGGKVQGSGLRRHVQTLGEQLHLCG